MKIREVRQISKEKVRAMCIRNELYDCGTNEDYDNLLSVLCNNDEYEMTTEHILRIAEDIIIHSDTEMDIKDIMFELINECCYTFIHIR